MELVSFRPTADQLAQNPQLRSTVRGSCRRLVNFLQYAWPAVPRVDGDLIMSGYIPVVCNYLEAAYYRKISRLCINLPPETLKSSLISVVFPAWIWSLDPRVGVLSISYDRDLASRDASDAKSLMESPWFRTLWHNLEFRDDTKAKSNYRNKSGGWRLATTRRGRVTGEHPRFVLWEDPLNARDAYDEKVKNDMKTFYRRQLSTRGRTKGVVHIISQQRLAPDDPSSIAYEANESAQLEGRDEPWTIIRFPMRFDPSLAMKDYGYGGDWRTETGQLLDPLRLTGEIVDDMERELGDDAPAQLQQDPKAIAGRIFKPECLIDIEAKDVPELDAVVRFVDKAATEGAGCETALVLVGKKTRRDKFGEEHVDYYILNVIAGQWDVDDVETQLVLAKDVDIARYGFDRYRFGMEEEGGSGGKLSARSTEKHMRGVNFESVRPVGNKDARAKPLARDVRLGRVFIVNDKWTPVFKQQMQFFPNGKFKDQVDAAAGAHLMLEGTLGKKKPRAAIMAGLSAKVQTICTAPGCEHPVAPGSDYCCSVCEVTSQFQDPSMKVDHSQECCQRAHKHFNAR